MPRLAAIIVLLLAALAPAAAQEGRYVFETREDGYVRFDAVSGDISVCRMVSDQIVCRMSADERRVLEEQIDALEARVVELEAALSEAGVAPADGFPSEDELDRTLGIMEDVFRRFHDLVEELESDPEGGEGRQGIRCPVGRDRQHELTRTEERINCCAEDKRPVPPLTNGGSGRAELLSCTTIVYVRTPGGVQHFDENLYHRR